jgi:FixJ family two-component response regulator
MSENKLICIVDDDASVRDSLSLVLGLKGYDCRTYESAESFLSSLPNRPACIILDLKMTGMSGLELQNRLLSLKVPVQIIFFNCVCRCTSDARSIFRQCCGFLRKAICT